MNCPHCGKKINILIKLEGEKNIEKVVSVNKGSCYCSLAAFNGRLGVVAENVDDFVHRWEKRPKSQKYLQVFSENEKFFRGVIQKLIDQR